MRILVTGAEGCVGRALLARGRARGLDVVGVGRGECDVTRAGDRERTLAQVRPDVVIFAAAHTAVDKCSGDTEAVNSRAPGEWASRVPTWWISTNYVFHERGPHGVEAAPAPAGVYATQKLAGEAGVLAAGGNVARVGWVLGPGGRTFGSTLARRLRAGETVDAIVDVLLQPTWSEHLADRLLDLPAGLTHHIGAGETSWYGLALALQARIGRGGVRPVLQEALGLPDRRPRDARLAPAMLPPWWSWLDALAALP